jgi:putative flippase GtrA
MLEKVWSKKLARFLVIGVCNTCIDLSILNTLVFFAHFPVIIANLISASISTSTSYFLNHHFVFRSKEKHSIRLFCRFFAVTGIGILGIQSLVIYIVTHLLKPHYTLVHNLINSLHLSSFSVKAFDLNVAKLTAVLVALVWNFMIYHFVVFKTSSDELEEDLLA